MARPAGHKLDGEAWTYLCKVSPPDKHPTKLLLAAGFPPPTIRSLRGGHHNASTKVAHRIAEILGCPPRVLFPGIPAAAGQAQGERVAA